MVAHPGHPKTLPAGSNPALSSNKIKIMITQARKIEHEKRVLIIETLFVNKKKTLKLLEIQSLKSDYDTFSISSYDIPISHSIGSCDVLTGKEADFYKKRLIDLIQKQYYADSN